MQGGRFIGTLLLLDQNKYLGGSGIMSWTLCNSCSFLLILGMHACIGLKFESLSGGECRRVERWLSWFIGWHAANSPSVVVYGIYWYKFRNKARLKLCQIRMHGISWNTTIVRRIRFANTKNKRRIPFLCMAANNCLLHQGVLHIGCSYTSNS